MMIIATKIHDDYILFSDIKNLIAIDYYLSHVSCDKIIKVVLLFIS